MDGPFRLEIDVLCRAFIAKSILELPTDTSPMLHWLSGDRKLNESPDSIKPPQELFLERDAENTVFEIYLPL